VSAIELRSHASESRLRARLRVPVGLALPAWARRLWGALRERRARDEDHARALADVVFGIVDLETTGLAARRDRILEIGLVVQRDGRVLERFSELIDVGMPIPPAIEALTGIRDEDLVGAPAEAEVVSRFARVLERCGVEVLIAHNARFDRGFLVRAWHAHRIEVPLPHFLCSLRVARGLVDAPRYGLAALVAALGLPPAPRHRALGDAEMTASLWSELLRRARLEGLGSLEALAALPPRKPRHAPAPPVDAPAAIG
jgi:DNA polymerase-3 subunit epsilon